MHTKTCAILQPHYLPWMGYFEMIDRVDIFVFLDDVQYVRREWKNRNRIRKTATDSHTKWLTVPVEKTSRHSLINTVRIAKSRSWEQEHLNSLKAVYAGAPCFEAFYPDLACALAKAAESELLADLNIRLVRYFCQKLGIETTFLRSSDLAIPGKRESKLLAICKAIGADVYLANNATAAYVGKDFFAEDDIGFAVQNYTPQRYVQKSKSGLLPFLPYLSIVDLLFNVPDSQLDLIRKGRPDRDE